MPAQLMVSVFVVEDDPITRARLVRVVLASSRLDLAGESADIAGALAAGERLTTADCVLIDLDLPDGDGTAIIERMTSVPSGPRVLVITVFGDESHVIGAIEAGANGYLLKDSSNEALTDSILRVVAGESPLSPAIARHLLRRFRSEKAAPQDGVLTVREVEVLNLIARGYSNGEIGRLLNVSVATISTHTKHMYRKLAVHSRNEAVFEASRIGLLELGRGGEPSR